MKAKGGYCISGNKKPCINNNSIKKNDWCYSCRTYTEKYIFTTSKLPKTQVPTQLTSQSHKTSMEMNMYTTVLRISVKCSKMINLRASLLSLIIARDMTVTSFQNGLSIKVSSRIVSAVELKSCLWRFQKLSIKFIDSLNFFQMPLISFPGTFGMNKLKKGYFPQYFNKECNKNYMGPIPSKTMGTTK